MGGFAEDALVGGTVSREHDDIDWSFPRDELSLRLGQAADLGFPAFETGGKSAPGEPFYLSASAGDLTIDIGVCNEIEGST